MTHGSNNTNWSIATGDIIGDIVVLYVLSAAAAATAAGISYLAITATAAATAHGTRQQQLGKQQQQWC